MTRFISKLSNYRIHFKKRFINFIGGVYETSDKEEIKFLKECNKVYEETEAMRKANGSNISEVLVLQEQIADLEAEIKSLRERNEPPVQGKIDLEAEIELQQKQVTKPEPAK